MRKNIFSKYIITFMVIVLVSFSALTLIVATLINDYVFDIKRDSMENTAESIYSTVNGIMSVSRLPLQTIVSSDNGYIVDILNKNAETSDAVIFITDSFGKVLISSDNALGQIPESVDKFLLEGYLSEDYLVSDLGGIFENEHINVIRPLNVFPTGQVDYSAESIGA
ncbi:MAG: hypothetical protein IIV81_02510, partial [Clostridia bacterium]|nr:hypothetical protein [Clostridia bacterium]